MGTISPKCDNYGLPISRLMVMRFIAPLRRPFSDQTELFLLPFTIALYCEFVPYIQNVLSS